MLLGVFFRGQKQSPAGDFHSTKSELAVCRSDLAACHLAMEPYGTIWNQECATQLALACGSWLKLQIRVMAICVSTNGKNTGFGPKLRYSVESKCCNLIPSGMMTLPWKIALWQISTYSIWWFSLPGWRFSDECCGSPTCSPQLLHFSSEGKLPGSSPWE